MQSALLMFLLFILTGCAAPRGPSSLQWSQLPPIPDREGFATPFAGISNGALIVAGGANFPGKRPWEGGTKIWYDSIFVLNRPDGKWATGFHLPRPVAYGVSITTRDGLLCIGGGDGERHFREVVQLAWKDGTIVTTPMPDLPGPCAFMCGALVGDTVYVAGGIDTPGATKCLKTFWALDLSAAKPAWRELDPWPGEERMLAVAGSAGESFFLFSGTSLSPGPDAKPVRRYLKDAWRYTPGKGWTALADLPRAAVAAPSPAQWVDESNLWIISGGDGLNLNFKPETRHPGFPHDVLAYDVAGDRWSIAGEAFSRSTVPSVRWDNLIVIPNGETRPGYRTPEVWATPVR